MGGPRKPSRDRLHVTVNRAGMLLMNRKAWETLGKPEAVRLFFDHSNEMIGIKPSDPDRTNAFPVKGRHYSRIISANPFCVNFGIEIEGTMAFNDVEIDETGTMRLRLRTATLISRPRKRRAH